MRKFRWRGKHFFRAAGQGKSPPAALFQLPLKKRASLVTIGCGAFLVFAETTWAASELQPHTREQIRILQEEKLSRTPAQKKLDSQLLYALREKRQGLAARNVASLKSALPFERDGRVLVDITAKVGPSLLSCIEQTGRTVGSS